MADPAADRSHPDGWSSRAVLGVLGAMVAIVVVVTLSVVVAAGGSGGDERDTTAAPSTHRGVAPLELSTVSHQIAEHYRYAQAHLPAYRQIPCWCGCQQFLGHRNLADCFVRTDGKGFEAHAAGCGVCIGEAAIAEEMLGQGLSPTDVKATVDRKFGATSVTTPAPSP